MIMITWNYIGVGNCESVNHVKELLSSKEVDCVCLLETKTNNSSRMRKMADDLGFTSSYVVETIEFAGGLLLLWRPDRFKLHVIRSTSQVIHGEVRMGGGTMVRVSFVFIRPNRLAKDLFWADCKRHADSFSGPWILQGDFNDIMHENEHWGSETCNFQIVYESNRQLWALRSLNCRAEVLLA